MKRKGLWTVFAACLVASLTVLVNCSGGGGGSSTTTTPPPVITGPSTTTTLANTNTTSGGVGVLSTNGKTVAFVPTALGLSPIIVDGSGTLSPALKAVRAASSPISTSFGIDSCSVDVTDLKVVCVGYGSSKVAVFDITNFVATFDPLTITSAEYDLAASVSPTYVIPTIGFSGGSCVNCGVATDPGEHRYIVSSGDGYRVLSYTSGTPLASYPIPINENFGFDPEKNWILSPEYSPNDTFTAMDGTTFTEDMTFRIVNIGNGKTYSWTKKMTCSDIDPVNCSSWSTTDSISIDPVTKIATMGEEWTNSFLFVDLSQAVFNDTDNTFTAPSTYLPLHDVASEYNWLTTGTAVEPLSHILLVAEELGKGIGVLQLPSSSGTGGAFPAPSAWNYNTMLMPDNDVCGTGYSWYAFGDPHGLAIFTSQVDNKPMGLLLDGSKQCAAIIDLEAFLAAPKSTATGETNIVSATTSTAFIKFIKL
jgi:hypothetical protein